MSYFIILFMNVIFIIISFNYSIISFKVFDNFSKL